MARPAPRSVPILKTVQRPGGKSGGRGAAKSGAKESAKSGGAVQENPAAAPAEAAGDTSENTEG